MELMSSNIDTICGTNIAIITTIPVITVNVANSSRPAFESICCNIATIKPIPAILNKKTISMITPLNYNYYVKYIKKIIIFNIKKL